MYAWTTGASPWRWIAALCVLFAGVAPASAQPLTLREAIAAAQRHNPDLQRYGFQLLAADALRNQAALRPAPSLAFSLENFAGTGATSGFDAAEATLTLSQVVELGGKREARVAAAEAGIDTLATVRQAAELDVLAEVTRRFIAVAERQALLALSARAAGLAENTARSTERRVRAAKAPHVEIDRASIALAQAHLDQGTAESRLDAARRSLSAMWGRDDGTLDGQAIDEVAGDLFRLPRQTDYVVLVERLAQSPDFLRYASEERLRDAELRLATMQRRADWTLGAGVRRSQDTGDTALVASISLPLFAGRRAAPQIAEAAARRDLVGAERQAALVRAKAQLYALYREFGDTVLTIETLERTALPKIDEMLRETEHAFERGRYSYLELIDAQREYLAIQRARIEAGARAQNLAAEIERLINAPLGS